MSKYVCKSCGSTAAKSVNVGFDGWFVGLWVATCFLAGGHPAWFLVFGVLAVAKTAMAFFAWKKECKTCGSGDVIPAASPVGLELVKTGG